MDERPFSFLSAVQHIEWKEKLKGNITSRLSLESLFGG